MFLAGLRSLGMYAWEEDFTTITVSRYIVNALIHIRSVGSRLESSTVSSERTGHLFPADGCPLFVRILLLFVDDTNNKRYGKAGRGWSHGATRWPQHPGPKDAGQTQDLVTVQQPSATTPMSSFTNNQFGSDAKSLTVELSWVSWVVKFLISRKTASQSLESWTKRITTNEVGQLGVDATSHVVGWYQQTLQGSF